MRGTRPSLRDATQPPAPLRLLLLSNGQGEDAIGALVATHLERQSTRPLALQAWPMVGRGEAYVSRGLPIVGPWNTLPSEGFGTLSLRAFAADVRAGWLAVHWRQLRAAYARREAFDACVAIGDVVPLAAAWIIRAPFALIGCAKSAYYDGATGYTPLERWLLRRAVACYARDARTAAALRAERVLACDLGNPMMDGVAGTAPPVRASHFDASCVACLPGSRRDRERNAVLILRLLAQARDRLTSAGLLHYVFALPSGFDLDGMHRLLERDAEARGWQPEPRALDESSVVTMAIGALRATFVRDALGDVLRHARVAIGLAGTANEQAVGCGVPVVTFATDGAQGDAYLRMKMPYFGPSALRVAPDAMALADALVRITSDGQLHARMAEAGRERMGAPGAARAIAADILTRVSRPAGADGS